MSYIGYFKSLHNDYLYSVTIRKKGDSTTPKEVILSGEEPFKVSYGEGDTIFEPIRTSVATIKVISDEYMEDILPSKAQETEVILNNDTKGIVEWVGYLTPKIYSQGYEKEFEEIELEAADVLSSTQYISYEADNKKFVSFKDIIVSAFNDTLISGFYWPSTKLLNGSSIGPNVLKISEKNFFSSDSDEPWSYQEILEEMSKYMGVTCMQWQDKIYFMDYTALSKTTDRFQFMYFPKSTNWAESSSKYSGQKRTITEQEVKGNGESISFEPIYNKIVVKDNFYACDELFKNLFDDDALTNRGGEFYSSFKVSSPAKNPNTGEKLSNRPKYKYNKSTKDDEGDDSKWHFWHRLYDHEDFQSVYRNDSLVEVTPTNLNDTTITQKYIGATIVDLGSVEHDKFNDVKQIIVQSKIDWERYLVIARRGQGWTYSAPNEKMVVFKTKPGLKGQVMMGENDYLIINYEMLTEKYEYRNYINPDWENISLKSEKTGVGKHNSELAFKLGIGGKYWDGEKWTTNSNAYFTISHEITEGIVVINKEEHPLNNVKWDLNINESGYKIPLGGVDTTGDIEFIFFLPKTQMIDNGDTKYNQYTWIKNFTIKTASAGQSIEREESDVVYENIIDEDIEYEFNDIEVKFTTSVDNTKPSYSNVIYWNGSQNVLLTSFDEAALTDKGLKAEENIIQRYYQQYSTPTKKLSYTFGMECGPFDKYYGMDVDNPSIGYIQNGVDIDYAMDTQIMTLIQKK